LPRRAKKHSKPKIKRTLPGPQAGIYTASKFAVRGLTESLRYNLAPHGIGCSLCCPALTRTNAWDSALKRPEAFADSGFAPADRSELEQFGTAFEDLDELIVTDIFASGEPNPDGVTGQVIVDSVLERSSTPVRYIADRREAAAYIRTRQSDADVVLVLGAGDIGELATWLTEESDEH
jgi:NAD(P)-dependent dehydrogenase (short-subunit alcohol dehydrogenase family)